MADLLLYDVRNRVATLTLNRPAKRNALSPELVAALMAGFDRAEADDDVGSLVLTGAGESFCAGADLGQAGGDGLLAVHEGRRDFAKLLQRFTSLTKPVVGAANGHALAGGFGLLMACDLVVARLDGRFGTPEIKRGLFPMMIVAVLLRTLGRRHTLDLVLTGREIDGDALMAMGGANRAVPKEQVTSVAFELAAQMASLSPAILALGRRSVFAAEDMNFTQQLDFLHTQLTLNTMTDDAAEGVRAFFEKRQPNWTGR